MRPDYAGPLSRDEQTCLLAGIFDTPDPYQTLALTAECKLDFEFFFA
jgi:hypothetical protein